VDLPLPLGPISATRSPCWMVRSIPRSTSTWPNDLYTSLTWRDGDECWFCVLNLSYDMGKNGKPKVIFTRIIHRRLFSQTVSKSDGIHLISYSAWKNQASI
jgi:hypothetical protein